MRVVCNRAHQFPQCSECSESEPHDLDPRADCREEADCDPTGSFELSTCVRVKCVEVSGEVAETGLYITCPCCHGVGRIKKEDADGER